MAETTQAGRSYLNRWKTRERWLEVGDRLSFGIGCLAISDHEWVIAVVLLFLSGVFSAARDNALRSQFSVQAANDSTKEK